MERYIISIVGQDRSGIVASVSQAIFDLKGNIEAASQTVHQGYFTMIVKCAFDTAINAEKLTDVIRKGPGDDFIKRF